MFNNPMYYENPYNFQNFGPRNFTRRSILGNHSLHRFNWSNILNNTQKTLNVINQAIPVYYQVKPIYNNAKTMLRMVSALKDDDTTQNNTTQNSNQSEKKNIETQGPVFFT